MADGALRPPLKGLLITDEQHEKNLGNYRKAFSKMSVSFLSMLPFLYTLKNPGFREEREWRLLSYVTKTSDRVEDSGLAKMDFYARTDRIVPFRSIRLEEKGIASVVKVVLGPRNITPKETITGALAKQGFKGVEVIRSQASYRRSAP